MSSPNPLHEFKMTHGDWPVTTPSTKDPIVNPLPLLLCRYPMGGYLSNPNFALISSHENQYDEYVDSLYAMLTSGSDAPIDRPKKKGAQTFWMKTYSENKGMLELLEELGVLRRTGQTYDQGFVTLVAVETVLVSGQWAEVCHHCGRREQLGTEEGRMKRCVKCKDAYYCNVECQKEDWPGHKGRCGILKNAAEKRSAIE